MVRVKAENINYLLLYDFQKYKFASNSYYKVIDDAKFIISSGGRDGWLIDVVIVHDNLQSRIQHTFKNQIDAIKGCERLINKHRGGTLWR